MKALLIIAQEGFQPHEYGETKRVLEEHNIQTVTASIEEGDCVDKFGGFATAQVAVRDVRAADFDVIALIGGPGAPKLAEYEEVMTLLHHAKEEHVNLAAICIAPTVLAKADVIEGKAATVWNGDGKGAEILEDYGITFVDEPVVVDECLVTANGPDAATAFGEKIVELLN